jgi:hypothetical protein
VLKDKVWLEAVPDYQERKKKLKRLTRDRFKQHWLLCLECVEKRLKRPLEISDFEVGVPCNDLIFHFAKDSYFYRRLALLSRQTGQPIFTSRQQKLPPDVETVLFQEGDQVPWGKLDLVEDVASESIKLNTPPVPFVPKPGVLHLEEDRVTMPLFPLLNAEQCAKAKPVSEVLANIGPIMKKT